MPQRRHLLCSRPAVPRPAGTSPGRSAHPPSGTPAGTPSPSRSCCRCPDSHRRGRFRRPWRRSCRRSGRASRCRARGPGSAGTSLRASTAPEVTGKWGCGAGGCPTQPPSPGTYLPYCRCKGAGVPRPSPPRAAGLLSAPSARGSKHRAAVSPCLWDLLPTPSLPTTALSSPRTPAMGYVGGSSAGCCSPSRLQPSSVLPAPLQELIVGQQAAIPPHFTIFPALCSARVGARIGYFRSRQPKYPRHALCWTGLCLSSR